MNVRELIAKLETINDKEIPVVVYNQEICNEAPIETVMFYDGKKIDGEYRHPNYPCCYLHEKPFLSDGGNEFLKEVENKRIE